MARRMPTWIQNFAGAVARGKRAQNAAGKCRWGRVKRPNANGYRRCRLSKRK